MKLLLITIIASFVFWGCENDVDNTAPKPPQGIRTISMDNSVEILWLPSQADDVKGYKVWVSDLYNGAYTLLGSTSETFFYHYPANNGFKYYYAVSAFDFNNNESGLSADVVYDTPRPDGSGVILYDYITYPDDSSGYDFSQYVRLSYDDIYTDFFLENYLGNMFLNVLGDTKIQDMGYTNSFDEISSAPTQGWARTHSVEAILGHTYVIKTWDIHYAKIRITELGGTYMVFDWAYQTTVGNVELKVSRLPQERRKPGDGVPSNQIN